MLICGETSTVLGVAFKVRVYRGSGIGGLTFLGHGFFTVNWNDWTAENYPVDPHV